MIGTVRKSLIRKRRKPPPTARQAAKEGIAGPSTDPATNLLLTDIVLRGATVMARMAIEQALLSKRYDPETAKTIVARRGLGKRLFSMGISRIAARSLPGMLIVGSGMAGKILLDRARAQRQARRATASSAAPPAKSPVDN